MEAAVPASWSRVHTPPSREVVPGTGEQPGGTGTCHAHDSLPIAAAWTAAGASATVGAMRTSRLEAFSDGVLGFVHVAICRNNHHQLMSTADRVGGPIMWANRHLLFWLSLVPFSTSRLGASRGAAAPAALCGLIVLMAGVAYVVLSRRIIRASGADGTLARAIGRDREGVETQRDEPPPTRPAR